MINTENIFWIFSQFIIIKINGNTLVLLQLLATLQL
jgi:hypothetical protein